MSVPARSEDLGQLGPAMRALPNDRWRAFVQAYLVETYTNKNKDNYGAQASAARQAGFGNPKTTPRAMAHIAWRIMRDERMIAAVREESQKYLRSIAPDAVKAVQNGIRNPEHKDHARFVAMVLDRSDPTETRHNVEVTHRHVDAEQEAIEELRALRLLGVTREKMIEQFGGNGLVRLEALEAADAAQRARDAKVIDGEAVVIEPQQQDVHDGP
jgi:hypothetical protein